MGSASINVEISDLIGGTRTIISEGNYLNRIRKVQVVHQISTLEISFYYGVQVGDGGMIMKENARVKGNVFSNGSVIAPDGNGFVDNNAIIARNGNRIEGLIVGENASVHTCKDSIIGEILTYVSGGAIENCTAGVTIKSQPNEIPPQDLPISQGQIDEWKNDAASGGILNNDYILDLGAIDSLGPIQIGTLGDPKNLTIINGANLQVTGTIYVTGDVLFDNNVIIELDNNAYGEASGMIITDGKVTVSNNATLRGSGETSSYFLILSNNNSLDPTSPAMLIRNNAEGAIFYTNTGLILLWNNIVAREVTGYKIQMNNNAEVEYESGLESALFSSGTGGAWQVISWKEVE